MALYKTHYVLITFHPESATLKIKWRYNPTALQMKLGYTRVQQVLKRYTVQSIEDIQTDLDQDDYLKIQHWLVDHFFPNAQDKFIHYRLSPSPYMDYSPLQSLNFTKLQIASLAPQEKVH